jgi:myo-inositol-1(or 4)-monophosphatase
MEAAGEAGSLLLDHFRKGHRHEAKGRFDLVTEADRACERLIVERLRSAFPFYSIVGEEGASYEGGSEYCWYIDPLDGTANFAHGFPAFCISIALVRGDQPVAAVLADPLHQETFAAERGAGAYLNGEAIRVSETGLIAESLLATVFPAHARATSGNVYYYQHLDSVSHGVRRAGSAALDLAYVASGRLDAMWGFGLHPWDLAAGVLLVCEAGGNVSDMKGRVFGIGAPHLLADNACLHEALLDVFREVAAWPDPITGDL